ncbi:Anaphase-promoting complex subunit [Phytophthora megakarya]|uniref:Anaphase-promoting complex subunit n=1 Tax=Phytophthora megakarya TaxID=4795 RepID=A0A225X166_9STRA|nr:Anaphase-promoting complex subunit [Phytophthora megakarya]
MEGRGLLLQRSPAVQIPSTSSKRPRDAAAVALARKNRRASTSNRGDGDRYKYNSGDKGTPLRPRYFTLRHPLDEVKPVAVSMGVAAKSEEKFLSDSALEAVDVLEDNVSLLLVAFHRWEQRFYVFRMNRVVNRNNCLVPEVKVVDGPTWTRYRSRSDLEELRVRIKPDWMVTLLWKSPRVGPASAKPLFLSPIISPASVSTALPVPPSPFVTNGSSMSSGTVNKVAFIASDVTGGPMMCVMDKDVGTLLLKPILQQQNITAMVDEDDSDFGVRILRCRDAVPISQSPTKLSDGNDLGFENFIDIVVLEKDGSLKLYRAHHPICNLTVSSLGKDIALDNVNESGMEGVKLAANMQLNSIDKANAYEIIYSNEIWRGKIWRCEHPMKVVSSSLLQQVFDVLDTIIPPVVVGNFKAHVICEAQHKAQNYLDDVDKYGGEGFEWQSFCENIINLLRQRSDSEISSTSVAPVSYDEEMTATSKISSFDTLCQSEFHDMYQYEHAMLFATMELPVTSMLTHSHPVQADSQGITRRTTAICHLYDLMFPKSETNTPHSNAFKLIIYLTQDPIGRALSLDDLPVGLSFPIIQIIRQVKHHPPHFITEDVCSFVGREDLSIASAGDLVNDFDYSENHQQQDPESKAGDSSMQSAEDEYRDDCDGLEDIISRSQPLFPADQRMKEVARLLRSSRPICLKLEKTPDLSDLDYAQQQQARLLLLCKRSMALSVGRGMVTLGSFDVATAQTQIWRLHIPALPLQGRKPPTNAIVELDLSGYAKELTYWPQFHNGCATGLRLPAHDLSGIINRHWIKYHRPSVNDIPQRNSTGSTGGRQASATQSGDTTGRNLEEAYAAHAGLLLGIGLRGHLKCLSMADVYNYLSLSNEFVTVAIMLGMASTAAHCRRKRKQLEASTNTVISGESDSPPSANEGADMAPLGADNFFSGFPELSSSDKTPLLGTGLELALERSVSKMLCLHVPSLLPPPFGGFSVPASTQTAALLGLGILYQGTGYRLMTELLLAEITRSPSSAQFVGSNSNAGLSTASFDQLEGYALAAGMALGLVVLGRGQATTGDPGLADLKLEEKLHKYIVGGAQQYRDTNAAGSCLYRGRRWQAFGSGGNGFNSAVNGTTPGNGTPSTTGTSPGAGRDTKHPSDRGGARYGGEHVNTGVTACASALALAFMYMQTNNKAVAVQLAVPDTLILLDYVRPDILLVRTLSKNLVMWDDILPTTQWIEHHEVPVQLLQAYKSIQSHDNNADPNSSTSHSDLHSICESYANVVAGACMSIGLRFAGTGNTTARTTLRKFVLHFRELRTKASSSSSSMILRGSSSVVAAATERQTVERCLAVCAQALALIDAGTGHVETLTLLRSITLRQRVDAAMNYGNHMALNMAIGLLFMGGGRASVSRSKEAIAALVISLYPMPPMNTADNKYHLQAFRHLYVLAVDTSRLLETVDVNSKTSCAVQVRVDLASGSGDESPYRLFRSPCLLPDISCIKRLVISDPHFYQIEILTSPASDEQLSIEGGNMKTANTLRLELLRNKNVVFLKRRQQKDFGRFADFTDELEQLHGVQNGYHIGGNSIDDRLRRVFASYFTMDVIADDDDCEDGEDDEGQLDVADWGSSWWASQLNSRALEQGKEEAQLLMPPYLNALHALFRLQQVPKLVSSMEVMDLKLFSEYCRLQVHLDDSSSTVGGRYAIDVVFDSNQTEDALGALWHRTSVVITSLASARVQLLVEDTPSTSSLKRPQSVVDAFFVSVLMGYFRRPTASLQQIGSLSRPADKDWKGKFQRVLAACSHAQHQSTSTAQFQLSAFLEQADLTEDEKTFWLKLVSFFLFSN